MSPCSVVSDVPPQRIEVVWRLNEIVVDNVRTKLVTVIVQCCFGRSPYGGYEQVIP